MPQRTPRNIPGHNLPLVALGGFILWLGWFGFNGGSIASLDSDNLGKVLLNTQLGACAGALGALLSMLALRQAVLMTVTVNGSIAGLVSITAGALYLSPAAAVVTGLVGGIIFVFSAALLRRWGVDDVVDAISAHGSAGAWGTIAVALFPLGDISLHQLWVQCLGVVVAFVWTFSSAFILLKLIDVTVGLRASTLHEQRGLDYTEHYELGYPEFQQSLRDIS